MAQCEIHELLALVYYDSLQSVVPFYDQRTVVPLKDAAWVVFCENSMRHFKKAFAHKYVLFSAVPFLCNYLYKPHVPNSNGFVCAFFCIRQDWSHAYYIGKLCEKLGYSYETSLSYYDKAIALNSTAVDPVYRMHASRLKLLFTCGKQNLEALKVISFFLYLFIYVCLASLPDHQPSISQSFQMLSI